MNIPELKEVASIFGATIDCDLSLCTCVNCTFPGENTYYTCSHNSLEENIIDVFQYMVTKIALEEEILHYLMTRKN